MTLLEMLVVIGILGVLLAIIVPVVVKVRAKARSIACMDNQRNIVLAALVRAQDNGGYLPLAGKVHLPDGTAGIGSLPRALADSGRRRYAYHPDLFFAVPTFEFPGSPIEALNSWPGSTDKGSEWVCPSAVVGNDVAARPTVSLLIGDDEYVIFSGRDDANSYAVNGGVSGFHYAPAQSTHRLRGRLIRVRNPSRVMWLSDGANDHVLSAFVPALDAPAAVSLADARDGAPGVEISAGFDRHRHGGWINIAFLDGHAESHQIDSDRLKQVFLTSH